MAIVVAVPSLLIGWFSYLNFFTDTFDGAAGLGGAILLGMILWTFLPLIVSLLLSWAWRNHPAAKQRYARIFWIIVGCLAVLLILNSIRNKQMNDNVMQNGAEHRALVAEALQTCTVTEIGDNPSGGLYIKYSDRPTFTIDRWVMTSDMLDEMNAYDERCPVPLNLKIE